VKPNLEVNENRGFAPETVIRTLAKTNIELREQLAIAYCNATVTPRSIKYLTTLANGAPEEIRTPDPQIRCLGRTIEIIKVRYRKKATTREIWYFGSFFKHSVTVKLRIFPTRWCDANWR
jgi:hypothetical protein